MATNRRRTPRSRTATIGDLTPALLHYFLHGSLDHSLEGYPECKGLIFFDDGRDKLLALWRVHRVSILAKWHKDNHADTMPYGWHRLERGNE